MKTERKQKTGMLSLDKLNNVKGVETLSARELRETEGGSFGPFYWGLLRFNWLRIHDSIYNPQPLMA